MEIGGHFRSSLFPPSTTTPSTLSRTRIAIIQVYMTQKSLHILSDSEIRYLHLFRFFILTIQAVNLTLINKNKKIKSMFTSLVQPSRKTLLRSKSHATYSLLFQLKICNIRKNNQAVNLTLINKKKIQVNLRFLLKAFEEDYARVKTSGH